MRLICFEIDSISEDDWKRFKPKFDTKYNVKEKNIISRAGVQVEWELLTGKTPKELNFLSDIIFDGNSPYKKFKFIKKIPNNKITRALLWQIIKKKRGAFPPMHIPFKFLKNFKKDKIGLKLEKSRKTGETPITIIGKFEATKHIAGSIAHIEKFIKKNRNIDQLFVNYVHSDQIGHMHGPKSKEYKNYLKQIIGSISKIIQNREDVDLFVILGIHGMVEIRETITLKNIERLNVPYFVNSPLIRFWPQNTKDQKVVNQFMNKYIKTKKIKLLSKKIANSLKLPFEGKHGTVYWLNQGMCVLPDFYHGKKKIKGMHGYLEDDKVPLMIISKKELPISLDKIKSLKNVSKMIEVLSEVP